MSIDAAIPLATYTVSGTGPYPLNWPYATETVVAMVLIGDAWSELSGTEARLEPLSTDTGGALYLDAATAEEHAGRHLHITRATPREQGWEGLSGTREKGLEQALDQLAMNVQELSAAVSRTLRVPAATVLSSLRDGALIMYEGGRFKSGPRVADLVTGGGGAAAGELTFDDFGAVGDGVTDDSDAIEAAILSGARRLRVRAGATYYINKTKVFRGLANLVIDLSGGTIQRGPDARAGWRFFDYAHVYVIADRSGLWRGNADTAGPYPGLFTTGGLKTVPVGADPALDVSSATATAAAAYGAGSTLTLTLNFAANTGWVKKGARLQFVNAGTTYSHIVQNDVQIAAGVAAGVQLDRPVAAAIASGQNIFVKWWGRHMVVAGDRPAGATTIELECFDVTSPDGNPRILAGEQFCFHTGYNDVLSIDYSYVAEVVYDADFTGAAPARRVTVVLKEGLPAPVSRGTMITSLQDGRNNLFADILFYGGSTGGVIGLEFQNLRFHGVAANACVRAPFDGSDPATRPNANLVFANNRDTSSDGAGGAFVGVWTEHQVMSGNTGIYSLGSMRSLCILERSSLFEVVGNYMRGGQYLCTMNGECSDGRVVLNHGKHCRREIRQANTCTRVTIAYNGGIAHATYTDFCVMVWAGGYDEERDEETASTARLNDTKVEGNTFSGRTRTAGGMGSHIIIGPSKLNPAAAEADWPRLVWVTGNSCTEPSQHGIWCMLGVGVTLELNSILRPGVAGILMQGGQNNALLTNEVIDAGTLTPSAGVVLNGGTGLRLLGNRTLVDTGTGMAKGLDVQAGAEIVEHSDNDWHGTTVSGGRALMALRALADLYAYRNYGWVPPEGEVVQAAGLFFKGAAGNPGLPGLPGLVPHGVATPEHAGMAGTGIAAEDTAYQALVDTVPAGGLIRITKPIKLAAPVAAPQNPVFEVRGKVAWPTTVDVERAMPRIVSNGMGAASQNVLHGVIDDAAGGALWYLSMSAGTSGSVTSFQRNTLMVMAESAENSVFPAGDDDDEPVGLIRRGVVAVEGRGYIKPGITSGAAWGMLSQVRIPATADGTGVGLEIGVFNEGSRVTDLAAPKKKIGVSAIAKVGSGTVGVLVKKVSTAEGWIYGVSVRPNALSATHGLRAFDYGDFWQITRDGTQLMAKPTGADAEQGIKIAQDGTIVQTRVGGTVSQRLIRGNTMAAAGAAANIDGEAVTAGANLRTLTRIQTYLTTPTDAAEAAELRLSAMVAGALAQQAAVGAGVTVGPGLAMQGAGTLNVKTSIWVNDLKVIGSQRGGWTIPTGTKSRAGYTISTATVAEVAAALAALIEDIHASGSGYHALLRA